MRRFQSVLQSREEEENCQPNTITKRNRKSYFLTENSHPTWKCISRIQECMCVTWKKNYPLNKLKWPNRSSEYCCSMMIHLKCLCIWNSQTELKFTPVVPKKPIWMWIESTLPNAFSEPYHQAEITKTQEEKQNKKRKIKHISPTFYPKCSQLRFLYFSHIDNRHIYNLILNAGVLFS